MRSRPPVPSTATSMPSVASASGRPRPRVIGMPRARATMAACPVAAPPARAMPLTSSVLRVATTEASRSSATMTAGAPSARWRSTGARPTRMSTTRRPTSRTSAARSRKYGSSTAPRTAACSVAASSIACSADRPPATIAASAGSTRPGSRAKSAWASKIGADLGAGAVPGLGGQAVQLRCRGLEGGEEPGLLDRDAVGRRAARPAGPRRRRSRIAIGWGHTVGPKMAPTPSPGRTRSTLEDPRSHVPFASAGPDRLGKRPEEQRCRGGAGILMTDAPLAEV